tara:strand:+ start:1639 stop:2334 length:696 start_codon:yes stop_codon:yes gene_type:complete
MSLGLIISRYSEDISWLEKFPDFKITIYNKGKELSNSKFYKIVNLPNVGRESHTWIYHIVKNYNNLEDVTIFFQGRIDDLGCMVYSNPKKYIQKVKKYGFAPSRYGMLGPYHWDWNVGIKDNPKYKDAWERNKISKSKLGFREFSKKLFPEIPIFVATSYGGCFAITKETIKKYDLKFYQNLLNLLKKSKNPIEGHYMERLWCYMFTKNQPFFDSIIDVIYTKIERLNLKN